MKRECSGIHNTQTCYPIIHLQLHKYQNTINNPSPWVICMHKRYRQKQQIHNIFIGHLSGSTFKSISIPKLWGSTIFLKEEEDPHHWTTPPTPTRIFGVECSLVNVTRRGAIINIYSWSHMSILNILVNFFRPNKQITPIASRKSYLVIMLSCNKLWLMKCSHEVL